MKITLLLMALCLAIGLVSAVHHRSGKQPAPVNRPNIGVFGPRGKRVPWSWMRAGGEVKKLRPVPARHLEVTKGEYVCGNKICKMQPGVVPKGCNGICQYPVFV